MKKATMGGCKIKFIGRNSQLKDSGYTLEEESIIYDRVLEDINKNPRWYLDQLRYLREFRVRWVDYRSKKPVMPYKYVKKDDI